MARPKKSPKQKKSRVVAKSRVAAKKRVAAAKSAIKRTAKNITARMRPARRTPPEQAAAAPPPPPPKPRKGDNGKARPVRVEPDIPLEILERTYTPKQTSLKTSFRSTGDDRQRDQEFAGGYADERWNDEDRFTNKSGDPRIGTHHRKYEPGE